MNFNTALEFPRQGRAAPTLAVLTAAVMLWVPCRLPVVAAETTAPAPQADESDVRLTALNSVVAGSSENLVLDLDSETILLGDSKFKLSDVLVIDFARPDVRPDLRRAASGRDMLLVMGSGEELIVRAGGGDENEIRFEHPEIQGADKIELGRLSAVVFPDRFRSAAHVLAFKRALPGWGKPPIALEERAWAVTASAGDGTSKSGEDPSKESTQQGDGPEKSDPETAEEDDVVVTAEGSELRGTVESFGRAAVRFEAKSIGLVELEFDKIRAVRLAQLGDAAPAASRQIEFAVSLVDGSFLRGRPLTLGGGLVGVHSGALGPIKVPLASVRHIEISGGQFQFLSDLDPVSARTRDLFSHHAVQRDVSYRGGPLRLRGQTFRKGLGMRSHARLDYALDDKYSHFQAIVGIDDEAQVTTLEARRSGGGIALFKVLVDDRVVFEKQLSVRDEPLTIDIPLDGGQILGIEVDHGPGLYILDYADWVDAKLIKK
jgi:hypothetical protein